MQKGIFNGEKPCIKNVRFLGKHNRIIKKHKKLMRVSSEAEVIRRAVEQLEK